MGNTCYLSVYIIFKSSSIITCLMYLPSVISYFIQNYHNPTVHLFFTQNCALSRDKKNCLSCELYNLECKVIDILLPDHRKQHNIETLKFSVPFLGEIEFHNGISSSSMQNRELASQDQHDAHEFLFSLLAILHEESIPHKKYCICLQHLLFEGTLLSCLECQNCKNISKT